MIYALAKELKDAGFPQGGNGTWTYPSANLVVRSADRVYVPTLSELIEACGENFDDLRNYGVSGWETHAIRDESPFNFFAKGKTPKEAVARLWLALQKK